MQTGWGITLEHTVQAMSDAKAGRIAGEMAHQAARLDISDHERDGFRTLAAATPAIRQHGIDDFFATRDSGSSTPPIVASGEGFLPAPQTARSPSEAPKDADDSASAP